MVLPHKKSKSNGNKIYSNPNIIIILLQMDDNVKFDFLFLHPQYHNNLTNNGAYDISKHDHKFEHNKMAQYLRKKKK